MKHRWIKLFSIGLVVMAVLTGILGGTVRAQIIDNTSDDGNQSLFQSQADKPIITLPNPIKKFNESSNIDNLFQFVVERLLLLGGIIAFIFMLYGGFRYITALGNPAAADAAKRMIIGSVVGIFIVAISYMLVRFVIFEVTDLLK